MVESHSNATMEKSHVNTRKKCDVIVLKNDSTIGVGLRVTTISTSVFFMHNISSSENKLFPNATFSALNALHPRWVLCFYLTHLSLVFFFSLTFLVLWLNTLTPLGLGFSMAYA